MSGYRSLGVAVVELHAIRALYRGGASEENWKWTSFERARSTDIIPTLTMPHQAALIESHQKKPNFEGKNLLSDFSICTVA